MTEGKFDAGLPKATGGGGIEEWPRFHFVFIGHLAQEKNGPLIIWSSGRVIENYEKKNKENDERWRICIVASRPKCWSVHSRHHQIQHNEEKCKLARELEMGRQTQQSTDRPTYWMTNQSINQSTDWPTDQPTNQPNESITKRATQPLWVTTRRDDLLVPANQSTTN